MNPCEEFIPEDDGPVDLDGWIDCWEQHRAEQEEFNQAADEWIAAKTSVCRANIGNLTFNVVALLVGGGAYAHGARALSMGGTSLAAGEGTLATGYAAYGATTIGRQMLQDVPETVAGGLVEIGYGEVSGWDFFPLVSFGDDIRDMRTACFE